MTTVSTLLALIFLPLLLEFYTTEFIDELNRQEQLSDAAGGFVIPITNIISSLVLVLLPVALDMWLRAKSPEW